jgi:CubicO group peptidase (beta-lactamase class C family)
MKNFFVVSFLLAAVLVFSCQSQNPGSTPESQGVSSRAVVDFLNALDSLQPGDLHGFVLMRHGQVVAEGWWDPYRPEYPHMLYSLSKSFTSTAIGIAQDEGLLSIYDPVISFFPEKAPANPSENLKSMRIKDLLRMSSGHQEGTMARIAGSDSWISAFLSLNVEHKPGTHFFYNTGATFMLAAIVQKVSGETLLDYLTPRLFEPLGIENPTWEMNPEGINMGGFGLSIRTEDIATFGQFLLQKGNWNGKQLVSKEWVEEATRLQTSNGSNPYSDWEQGYGYQFWMCRNGLYRGDGAFGQYCIVMNDLDAVLAINAGTANMQGIMNIAWDHLLPAMKAGTLPADPKGVKLLESKLATLSVGTVQGKESGPHAADVSGKNYIMEPNEMAISWVRLDLEDSVAHGILMTPDGEKRFDAGFGEWVEGRLKAPPWESDKMWASGAWTADNTYSARLVYTETPYKIDFTFRFEGDQVFLDTRVNVSLTPGGFPTLTGRASGTQ